MWVRDMRYWKPQVNAPLPVNCPGDDQCSTASSNRSERARRQGKRGHPETWFADIRILRYSRCSRDSERTARASMNTCEALRVQARYSSKARGLKALSTEASPSFSALLSEKSGMRTDADVNFLGDKVRPELLRQYSQWSGFWHLPAQILGHNTSCMHTCKKLVRSATLEQPCPMWRCDSIVAQCPRLSISCASIFYSRPRSCTRTCILKHQSEFLIRIATPLKPKQIS